ncbi:MAG: YcnI family protein [Pseudomonadota bacterium]
MKKTTHLPVLAAALLAGAAHAHVTLEYEVATAGAPYKATFKVGHGCGASPTREIVVTIPDGVRGAKPMAKPGWAIELQRKPGGEEVARIVWRARTPQDALPSNHYDEFALVARMPQQPGPLYWPVSQACEEGRLDWTEVPRPGQDARALKSPAAALEILPAGETAGGHHH